MRTGPPAPSPYALMCQRTFAPEHAGRSFESRVNSHDVATESATKSTRYRPGTSVAPTNWTCSEAAHPIRVHSLDVPQLGKRTDASAMIPREVECRSMIIE